MAFELGISHQTVKNHSWEGTLRTEVKPKDLQDMLIGEIQRRADEFVQLS